MAEVDGWTVPSWDRIVREHSARVFRLAFHMTGNRYDAEDLTQETFIRVFRSLKQYRPGTFEGWINRIAVNLYLDMVRHNARVRVEEIVPENPRMADTSSSPEVRFAFRNLDLDVQHALNSLPPDFKAVIVLCDIEGLSYEEIADLLDIKLGTVRSRIFRARAMLRAQLPVTRTAAWTPVAVEERVS